MDTCRPCGNENPCPYGCGCGVEVEKMIEEGTAWWLNEEQVMPKWRETQPESQAGAVTHLPEPVPNTKSAPCS